MSEPIRCFLVEATDRERRWLRRYGGSGCPGDRPYHDAKVQIEDAPDSDEPIGDTWPHDDPRWPETCDGCPYPFTEDDDWQLARATIWRRAETDEEFVLLYGADVPPGAMWDMDWMSDNYRGPDGLALAVQTPGGPWYIDGPASDGGRWTRTGTPPDITVSPSIAIGDPIRYHGWLRDGYLVDA